MAILTTFATVSGIVAGFVMSMLQNNPVAPNRLDNAPIAARRAAVRRRENRVNAALQVAAQNQNIVRQAPRCPLN